MHNGTSKHGNHRLSPVCSRNLELLETLALRRRYVRIHKRHWDRTDFRGQARKGVVERHFAHEHVDRGRRGRRPWLTSHDLWALLVAEEGRGAPCVHICRRFCRGRLCVHWRHG